MSQQKRQRVDAVLKVQVPTGAFCVALANTVAVQKKPAPRPPLLRSFADLLALARQSDALDASQALQLSETATEQPESAAAVFEQALRLRPLLREISVASARGERPPPTAAENLNTWLRDAQPAFVLVPGTNGGFAWAVGAPEHPLQRILWLAACSAAQLMTLEGHRRQVRRCAGRGCHLLFLDRSTGQGRTWCNKGTCGSREKNKRRYCFCQGGVKDSPRTKVL
jgi:predicted RNA-binding Zn ribbon-like protein